jgi:hypothetical protein
MRDGRKLEDNVESLSAFSGEITRTKMNKNWKMKADAALDGAIKPICYNKARRMRGMGIVL